MTAHRDPDRLIDAFLMEGQTVLADPVYDAVRDRIERTRQRAVIGSWRTPDVNRYLKIGLAAAAVVIIAFVGYRLFGGSNVGGPGATETPQPTSSPTATPQPSAAGGLQLGPFALARVGSDFEVDMTVTIGAPDWNGDAAGILVKRDNADPPDGSGLIVYTGQLEVYGDSCHWLSTRPNPMTAPTVDAVIAALAAQVGRNATKPADITVDGYRGKSIQLSVPTDIDFATCDGGKFASWGPDASRYHQGPGQIDQVWVLDVRGHLATIDAAWYAGTSASDRAELDAILASLTFK